MGTSEEPALRARIAELLREIREISDLKKAQDGLRESERRFRELADTAPVMIWIAGTDKLCTFFNKSWLDFTGRTMEQELGNGWAGGVHPDDLDRCFNTYAVSFDARRKFHMEYRLRRADGEYRWILDNGIPLDREGEFAGYIGSCIDVTGQKVVEERLRASEARLNDAQRLAKIGNWELDLKTDTIVWSDETYRIHGLPSVPPNLAAFLNHVHSEDRGKIREAAGKVRSGGGRVDLEYRIIRPDGEVRFVRAIVEAIGNELGTPVRIVGTTQDITEHVKAREVLRVSEERLKNAERLAHVGNWHWDIKANRISGSEEMFRIFGKPPDFTATYEQFLQDIVPQDRERIDQEIRECFEGTSSYSTEYRIALPNGDVRTIRGMTELARDEDGSPLYMFGACQDVTDFRRTQEEAMARQKLESVGLLAGGIAHDFNNLLGGILAEAELVDLGLDADSALREEIKGIKNGAIRGAEIVRQLMIYAGQESEVRELVDVSQTVKEMLELLQVSVSKHAILETDLGKDLPPVRANAAQISQIVMNLVTNASEAIGEREGLIRLTTRFVPGGHEGDYLKLEVSDTGSGISQETQAKMFDPFFTTKSAGRGLGLAVVHGIVRDHGGAIHFRSEPGKGTTFEVLLPRAENAARPENHPIALNDGQARQSPLATVLIVEDEDLLRQAVSKMLRRAGFSVIETRDGSAALEVIRGEKSRIDVLLLDITLPGTPSREVFEGARRLRPEMRTIITSAYPEDMAAASLQRRFERFIRKPYSLRDLVALVQESGS